MGTTAEKLTYLNTTKQKIKDAINNIGGNITSETTFRQYVAALESIYQSMPKVSGTGTSLSLSPTLKGLMQIDLKGNTSQVQLSGINKLPLEDIDTTKNSVRIYTSNGNIYLNGTNSTPIYSNEKLKTFTLKAGTYTSNPNVSGVPNMFLRRSDNDSVLNLTNRTFTLSEDTSVYLCAYIGASTYTNYQLYWGLQEGTSYNDYEQYCGGTPSPNPSYPQDIHNVSGNNNIVVCGKNVININGIYSTSGTSNLQRSYDNGVATLTWSSGFSLYMVQDNSKNNFIPLPDSTKTYTISFKHKGNALYLRFDESTTDIIETNVDSDYTTYSYTFSGLSEIKVKIVRKDTTGTAYLKDFQIEVGNQATTYEAYTGTTYPINLPSGMELCKIGDYKDYFYKDSDKWYLHKETGKVVLDGSDSSKWSYGNGCLQSTSKYPSDVIENVNTRLSLSNYFIYKNYETSITSLLSNGEYGWNTLYYLSLKIDNMANKQAYLDWLTFHEVLMYYTLQTPTNTEITDTTLIEQLEAIKSANSYYGTTNINQVNNDMPFILDVSCLKGE